MYFRIFVSLHDMLSSKLIYPFALIPAGVGTVALLRFRAARIQLPLMAAVFNSHFTLWYNQM